LQLQVKHLTISLCLDRKKPNVLFIVVDDLRTTLGAYDYPKVHTPNIDQFAAHSVKFENAHAQQTVCGPSRTSFLTGRRPDTTRLYDFGSYWRKHAGNFTTIPQHFKQNGYFTYSIGKIFHPGICSGRNDDFPYSWSKPAFHPPTQQYKMKPVCPGDDGKGHVNLLCAVNVTSQPQQSLPDIQSSEHAVETIKSMASSKSEKPFFLAVGFHKPHIPYKFPEEYLKFYPIEDMDLAPYPYIPRRMPLVAYSSWPRLFVREDFKKLNVSWPFGPVPELFQKKIRQHYYASVTYTDAMIGKVLNQLEESGLADDTVISFVSDHGWSLGDHGDWCKYENFEVVTRVPMIVHVPAGVRRATSGGGGRAQQRERMFEFVDVFNNPNARFPKGPVSHSLVENVDLFATLSELATLQVPPTCPTDPFDVEFCTEGTSFAPHISNAIKRWETGVDSSVSKHEGKPAVFSQYPRPSEYPQEDTDLPRLKDIKIMGYSMRTQRYRYTEWVKFDPENFKADFTQVHARELYLHESDPLEVFNVADFPLYHQLVEKLSLKLIAGWRHALPK